MASGSSHFTPILHNITPERVVFCYKEDDSDSLDVAQYYRASRGIPESHLIALPCSDAPYITEFEYETDIERPLLDRLEILGNDLGSGGTREIWAIILGYNVPIAFYDDSSEYIDPYDPNNLIAIASRLHRLGHDRSNRYANPVYDRRSFKFFDSDDAPYLYITSVITGPTKSAAIKLIDRSLIVDNLPFVTGKVFVDPYGLKSTSQQLSYQTDILDFVSNELPNLGLDSEITIDTNDMRDPQISSLERDAFYIGWFTDRSSISIFLNQNEKRVFLYNADNDAAAHITEELDLQNGSDPWCSLAINIEPGYASTAGSVAPPGESSYLRPRPFFATLHQGAGIGEAFLAAMPVVDWRTILIGDPLMVVNFPSDVPADQDIRNTQIPNHECIRRIKETLEESLAYGVKQSILLDETVDTIVSSSSFSEELHLLYNVDGWRNIKNTASQNDLFTNVFDAFLTYISRTTGLTFEQWLTNNSEQTTKFVNDLLRSSLAQGFVNDDLIRSQGYWDYTFQYIHTKHTLQNVYFEMEWASDSAFESITASVNSLIDIDGWQYESEKYIFTQLSDTGFPSNFSGRQVKYSSPVDRYLERLSLHYVRWRAINSVGSPISDWHIDTNRRIIKT